MKRRKRKKKVFVVRPWSDSVCPTADELRSAWANRRRSQKDFIILLSVLGELTCFTDCTLEAVFNTPDWYDEREITDSRPYDDCDSPSAHRSPLFSRERLNV